MPIVDITPVDEVYAARILTTKTIIIGNLLTLTPLVFMFAGVGLVYGAAELAFFDEPPDDEEHLLNPFIGGLLIAIGVVVAAASAYWGLRNNTKLGNRYLRRLARLEIKYRPDSIVDPDNREAIFVEIVPRENWKRLMLETASDVGFLLIDEARRELLFEGDRERIRIRAAGILTCEVEMTIIGEGTGGDMNYYFTVIRVEHDATIRELPFAFRGDLGQLGATVRERRANSLRDHILSMRCD